MDSYHYWERFLSRDDFTFGRFGENFTVEGLPDNEVCIGDRYRIGGAEFEVTQPYDRNHWNWNFHCRIVPLSLRSLDVLNRIARAVAEYARFARVRIRHCPR
jgi:hypothetical protein